MSEAKSGHDWSKDWQALQRQYWTAWSDLTRSQAGTPDPATPWHEGLEQWARMFGSAGKQSEAVERLMASAKGYLSLMQAMMSFAAGKDASALGTPSWLDALRGGMSMPGFDPAAFGKMPGFDPAAFGKIPGLDPAIFGNMPGFDPALLDNPLAKALRDISGQGVKGIQQLAEGAAPMLEQMQAEGLSWLKAPAFGYAREHQEHYQKMAVAFVEFQQASKRYNALIMKASQRSFEILESKLAERSEPGRQIDSVRALYDLWVDAAEEAYAEVALSEEFRKVYGDVVNAQMRVRAQMQQEVERIGVDLGMPTRTELNSVHKRLHELRRELRNGRGSTEKSEATARDAEIAVLRGEVEELKRLLANFESAPGRQPGAPATPIDRTKAKPEPAGKRSRRPTPAKRAVRAPAAKRARVAGAAAVRPARTRTADAAAPPDSRVVPMAAPARAARVAQVRKGTAPPVKPAKASRTKPAAPAAKSFGAAIEQIRRAAKRKKSAKARVNAPAKTASTPARRIRSKA